MIRLFNILFISLFALTANANSIPDFSANYLVQINGIQAGELKRILSTQDNGVRLFSSTTQAKGVFAFFKPDLVEERSQFQSNNGLIMPISYLYQRTGGKKEKFLSLNFDWPNQRVHIDDHQHPWTLAIKANTLDKLVYQLALMSDLAENKQQFNYQIADGGKIKTFSITKLTDEIITTPLGKISTVKLIRQRDKAKGRQTILWCAPGLNYLPVKLEHTEKDGSVFTAYLRRLKGIDPSSAFSPIHRQAKPGEQQ